MTNYYNDLTTDPKEELLSHVDENDVEMEGIRREECHNESIKPWHRNSHVYIINSQGELYITRRSHTKDTSPDLLTVTTAGHIRYQEDPKESAQRELMEELCLEVDIHFVKKYKVDYGFEREFIYVYFGKTDNVPKIGNEEVGEIIPMPLETVVNGIKDGSLILAPGAQEVVQMLIQENLLRLEMFN
jgi:isopentenyldiphosphate isomerase